MTPGSSDAIDAGPEQQRWQADLRLRERELDIKERAAAQDAAQKAREFDAKLSDQRWARWTNPLVLAIFAAALAAFGNTWLAYVNGAAQRELELTRSNEQIRLEREKAEGQLRIENSKAEAARILEVIKTDDPEKAAVNLAFLLDAGLIADAARKAALKTFLDKRQPGEGPSIPPVGAVVPQGPPDQPMSRLAEVDLLARLIYTESRGSPLETQRAVANVVMNRKKCGGRYPSTLAGVINQPKQFSSRNQNDPNFRFYSEQIDNELFKTQIWNVSEEAIDGKLADNTGGATLYHSIAIEAPRWTSEAEFSTQIGSMKFYRLGKLGSCA
jgi:spore germination cell wall hydrolase CwlJ-like protein